MGELNTISVKNEARKKQIERERELERRKKRALREKQRKMQLIRYYCAAAITVMILLIVIILVFDAVFNSNTVDGEKSTSNMTASGEQQQEQLQEAGFDPSQYTFTAGMYMYDNTAEILEKLDNLMLSQSDISDKVQFIKDNQQAYPENLIKLISKSPEAIDFAVEYPFKRGESDSKVVDISDDYTEGEIPLFLQWDDRWGYVSYGDDIIGLDGCGPTCLSMVAVGLTGNVKWTPVRVARMSMSNGHYVEGQGTAWTLMYEGCKQMGLEAKVIGLSEEEMAAELIAGRPIIASMAPGDFTDAGHFIVFTEYKDGKFYVNDPNSRKNSATGWEYDRLKTQIKNMWSYTVTD